MKQDVEFKELDDFFSIAFVDQDEYIIEKQIEPEDKLVTVGVTKGAEVRIKQVDFPKTMYSHDNVKLTADTIRTRFQQEGCKSCIAMAEVNNTPQTFLFPTPKQMIGDLLDTI